MSVALFIQYICVEEGSDFLLCKVIWVLVQVSESEQSHPIVKAWQRKESAQFRKKNRMENTTVSHFLRLYYIYW